jgi:hypothetical protein
MPSHATSIRWSADDSLALRSMAEHLQVNGGWKGIGERFSCTPSAARNRVQRMNQAGEGLNRCGVCGKFVRGHVCLQWRVVRVRPPRSVPDADVAADDHDAHRAPALADVPPSRPSSPLLTVGGLKATDVGVPSPSLWCSDWTQRCSSPTPTEIDEMHAWVERVLLDGMC